MTLAVDRTLLTNACTWVARAHNTYTRNVGNEAHPDSPSYWVEAVKSYARGGNDLSTGITSGSPIAVAQVGGGGVTINITGGACKVLGAAVTCATNATFGSAGIFSQTCTDGLALVAGQFYDAALTCDHLGVLGIAARGPREDRVDSEQRPDVPLGHCLIAMIRVRYQASTSVILTADITLGQTLTAYAAPSDDAFARLFAAFDTGQTKLIARTAVKSELAFALTALDTYVTTITASLGQGTNGAGQTLLTWAKATHPTATPFDFPDGWGEYIRSLRSGRDHSMRLATVAFTGSGTATVVDKLKVMGELGALEVVVSNVGNTGAAASVITVTAQSTGATTALVYTPSVPANTPNGTVVALTSTGTAATQSLIPGTAALAVNTASNVISAQPTGTVPTRVYTSLVASSPITVIGGTSGDTFVVRNTGTV